MNNMHDNKVNNTAECNLLYGILNSSKLTKNINIHCSPILCECINTPRVKAEFNNF